MGIVWVEIQIETIETIETMIKVIGMHHLTGLLVNRKVLLILYMDWIESSDGDMMWMMRIVLQVIYLKYYLCAKLRY